MVCLGLKPGAEGWKAQTNPLSYGGTTQETKCLVWNSLTIVVAHLLLPALLSFTVPKDLNQCSIFFFDWDAHHCKTVKLSESGCGSGGRAVASSNRDSQFEYSHRQNLYWTFVYCKLYWNHENKEKEAGNDPLKKLVIVHLQLLKMSTTV